MRIAYLKYFLAPEHSNYLRFLLLHFAFANGKKIHCPQNHLLILYPLQKALPLIVLTLLIISLKISLYIYVLINNTSWNRRLIMQVDQRLQSVFLDYLFQNHLSAYLKN